MKIKGITFEMCFLFERGWEIAMNLQIFVHFSSVTPCSTNYLMAQVKKWVLMCVCKYSNSTWVVCFINLLTNHPSRRRRSLTAIASTLIGRAILYLMPIQRSFFNHQYLSCLQCITYRFSVVPRWELHHHFIFELKHLTLTGIFQKRPFVTFWAKDSVGNSFFISCFIMDSSQWQYF